MHITTIKTYSTTLSRKEMNVYIKKSIKIQLNKEEKHFIVASIVKSRNKSITLPETKAVETVLCLEIYGKYLEKGFDQT